MTADRNANVADAKPIGTVSRMIHFTPHKFITAKKAMIPHAITCTDTPGSTQLWIAPADNNAQTPQVGIQPHQ